MLAPMWSMYEKPQPAGGWSGRPELKVSPETACTIGPQVLNAEFGPVAPKPEFDTYTMSGLIARSVLVGEPHAAPARRRRSSR